MPRSSVIQATPSTAGISSQPVQYQSFGLPSTIPPRLTLSLDDVKVAPLHKFILFYVASECTIGAKRHVSTKIKTFLLFDAMFGRPWLIGLALLSIAKPIAIK